MYFANTSVSTNLILYKGLLDRYLKDQKDQQINDLFSSVIIITHKLITGQIKESEVDHKVYNLVVELSDHNKTYTHNYFKDINPENIGLEQLETLRNILNSLIASDTHD